MAALIDPTTGRPAVTGPNGEGALAAGDPRIGTMGGLASWMMPDGRQAWYVPGQNVSQGNVQALANYQTRPPVPPSVQPAGSNSQQLAAPIINMLRTNGFDEMIPMVDDWVRQGLSWAEIEVQLRDPSSGPGKVFDRLIPEVRLRREAGKDPMSVDQIQQYRTRRREVLRAAGAPEGFYDADSDATADLVGDVSLSEVQARAEEYAAYGAQLASDPAVAAELDGFERFYGVRPSGFEVAAMALDQAVGLPAVQRRFKAVGLDLAAGRAGFGDLARTEAERLADLGVSQQQAQQGFSDLGAQSELFGGLPGSAEDQITRDEQLGAAFEGNANARRRIEKRARQRAAAFQGGGSFSQDRQGFGGIGTAR